MLRRCTLTANHADEGGAIHVTNVATDLDLFDCIIRGNRADSNGGGMFIRSTFANLTGCNVSGNIAGAHGGGVYNRWGVVHATDCVLDDNHALNGAGGAWYASNADPTFERCSFGGNSVGGTTLGYGGAVYHVEFSQGTYIACSFVDNIASSAGGAIAALYSDSYPRLYGCMFEQCSASAGGAVSANVGTPIVDQCTFVDNSAGTGGALHAGGTSSVTITNSRFLGNTATLSAGAIYTSDELAMTNSLLAGNHANQSGGAALRHWRDRLDDVDELYAGLKHGQLGRRRRVRRALRARVRVS